MCVLYIYIFIMKKKEVSYINKTYIYNIYTCTVFIFTSILIILIYLFTI
jgi:hypothetical protein